MFKDTLAQLKGKLGSAVQRFEDKKKQREKGYEFTSKIVDEYQWIPFGVILDEKYYPINEFIYGFEFRNGKLEVGGKTWVGLRDIEKEDMDFKDVVLGYEEVKQIIEVLLQYDRTILHFVDPIAFENVKFHIYTFGIVAEFDSNYPFLKDIEEEYGDKGIMVEVKDKDELEAKTKQRIHEVIVDKVIRNRYSDKLPISVEGVDKIDNVKGIILSYRNPIYRDNPAAMNVAVLDIKRIEKELNKDKDFLKEVLGYLNNRKRVKDVEITLDRFYFITKPVFAKRKAWK